MNIGDKKQLFENFGAMKIEEKQFV